MNVRLRNIALLLLIKIASLNCQLNWFSEFTQCLKKYSNIHKIILNFDKTRKPNIDQFQQLVLHISQDFSTVLTTFDDKGFEVLFKSLPQYVPSFTLFIYATTITSESDAKDLIDELLEAHYVLFSNHQEPMKFIIVIFRSTEVSENVVINLLKTVHHHDEFIEGYMKILDIAMNQTESVSFMQINSQPIVQFHEYNAYVGLYTIKNISSVNEIFPIILKNLNGRKLRLSLAPYFPFIDVQTNDKGCAIPETLAGPQGLILKTIAESSNFTWQIIFIGNGTENALYKDKRCVIDFFSYSRMRQNRLDVNANFRQLPFISDPSTAYAKYVLKELQLIRAAHVRRQEPLVILVPILHTNNIVLSKNFVALFITTVVMIFVLKFAVRLMKFNYRFWSIGNIWFAIFGMGIKDRTKFTDERLVLCGILIVSVIYSIAIIDQLLDVQMDFNREFILTTLDEFVNENLTLMLTEFFHDMLKHSGVPLLQNLANKSILPKQRNSTISYEKRVGNKTYIKKVKIIKSEKIDQICIENLMVKSYKNISCVMYLYNAENQVRLSALKHGKPNIAVLKESAFNAWLVIFVSPAFTCIRRFEQVMQYLIEAGLIDRWYQTELIIKKDENGTLKRLIINKDNNRTNIINQLLIIAIIGYIASFFIFLGEIIKINSISKKGLVKKFQNLLYNSRIRQILPKLH